MKYFFVSENFRSPFFFEDFYFFFFFLVFYDITFMARKYFIKYPFKKEEEKYWN